MAFPAFPGLQEDTRESSSDRRHLLGPVPGGALRILLLNYEYPPLGGGAGIASAALAQSLASRGVMVDVVTSRPASAPDASASRGSHASPRRRDSRSFAFAACAAASTRRASSARATYLLSALPVARRLLRERRYDIVHIYFSLPTGALLPALPLGDIPVVVSLRGSDVPGYDERNAKLVLAHRVLRPLTRWIWRRASRVVPVCDSLGALARETLATLEYSVIGNGVDLDLFRPGSSGSSRAAASPVRCLAVARLIARKGISELLHAWSLLPRGRYALEIVGDGPQRAELRALASTLGIESEVTFAGSLDREELAARCQHSDLFVLAPHEEAFGNVFAEALAAGLPVVGSNIGAIPELVREWRERHSRRAGRLAGDRARRCARSARIQ